MVISKVDLGKKVKDARYIKSKAIKNKYTQKMLADDVEVSRSYIGDIEVGRTYPSFKLLTKIAEACGVPLNYFGDIDEDLDEYADSDHNLYPDEDNADILNQPRNKEFRTLNKNYLPAGRELLNRIPLLGSIRAGVPLLTEDNWEELIEVPSHILADFALRVTGDSMSWAGIHEGDIAILKKINIPHNGMIVAAGIERGASWEATLKYYTLDSDVPILRAANPDYEDIEISPEHRIIGHVVFIYKNPPAMKNYKEVLAVKEMADEKWMEAVETATSKGLDGEKAVKLFDLFADMVKKI